MVFFKPTFSGLYTIQYLLRSAKTPCAKTAVRQNGPAPKRRRQTGRAKPAAPKRHVPFSGTGKMFLNTSQASPAPERYQISNTSPAQKKYLNKILRRRKSLGSI